MSYRIIHIQPEEYLDYRYRVINTPDCTAWSTEKGQFIKTKYHPDSETQQGTIYSTDTEVLKAVKNVKRKCSGWANDIYIQSIAE